MYYIINEIGKQNWALGNSQHLIIFQHHHMCISNKIQRIQDGFFHFTFYDVCVRVGAHLHSILKIYSNDNKIHRYVRLFL